ncbi:MAG: ComEC/Rec2 family competence protein [Chthoniobacterales bacterium]
MMTAWPRQPFLGLALAASAGIVVADGWPNHSINILLCVGLAVLGVFLTHGSLATYTLVATAFFYIHSLVTTDSAALRLAQELGSKTSVVVAEGTVMSEPKLAPNGFSSFLFRLHALEIDGTRRQSDATLFARSKAKAEFGDELRLFGVLQGVSPPRNPGEFDMRSYLARKDVRNELVVRYAENVHLLRHTDGNLLLESAQKSRHWMQTVLRRGLEDSPEVTASINGMVLGLRHQTPEDVEEPFQQTGTLHLFAVAGLHVGIVAQLLWTVAMIARVPRKWATALIIPALMFYAAVTGLHTSSVRAALMASLLLGGFFVARRVFALNSLAAAAMLLLSRDTNELFAVGFQLSFAVVGTIILLSGPLFRFVRPYFASDPFLPRSLFSRSRRSIEELSLWVARAGSVSCAAWLGSLPLMLRYYHLVTPISLLANLVVIPIAYCVLAGGLISLLAAPVSAWISVVFNNANWSAARLIIAIVHAFARLPAGHFYFEQPHWPRGARAEIMVLDAGAGAAVHVRDGRHDWMFDAGGKHDYERFVREYLRSRGVNRLDGLLLTHGDAAHIGGASSLLHNFAPRLIADFAGDDRSRAHAAISAEIVRAHIAPRFLAGGDELALSPRLTARVLFPQRDFHGQTADDQALVLQLLIDGKPRALLLSDSGEETERMLLSSGLDLRSDVLIKGQHHSAPSASSEFLAAVQPQVIVATSRDFPQKERIADDWTEMVRARRITLLRQDKTGAVKLVFFRDHWEAKAFLQQGTLRSTSQ